MSYSDKAMKDATQIAYLYCIEKSAKNLMAEGKPGPYTLRELISANIDMDYARQHAEADGKDPDYMSFQELAQYSDISDFDKRIIKLLSKESFGWKIVDIHDTIHTNGLYGCVIETSKDEAIVAFRGSEGTKTYDGLIYDWIQSDLGLYNTATTPQHAEVENYANQLAESGLLDKYKFLACSGHSLGGNLASHFGVANYINNPEKPLFKQLQQVINFDGPGVSDEYLKKYSSAIEKAAPKITYYKWSLIGCLLFDLPNQNIEYLKIDEEQRKSSPLERIAYKTVVRHDTRSLLFDKER